MFDPGPDRDGYDFVDATALAIRVHVGREKHVYHASLLENARPIGPAARRVPDEIDWSRMMERVLFDRFPLRDDGRPSTKARFVIEICVPGEVENVVVLKFRVSKPAYSDDHSRKFSTRFVEAKAATLAPGRLGFRSSWFVGSVDQILAAVEEHWGVRFGESAAQALIAEHGDPGYVAYATRRKNRRSSDSDDDDGGGMLRTVQTEVASHPAGITNARAPARHWFVMHPTPYPTGLLGR